MNVITTVVIATALLAVCDVSQAAQPAASKMVHPQASTQTVASSAAAPSLPNIRESGKQAQQQILRDAIPQNWQQLALQPLPMLAPVEEERVVESELSSRQVAVK
ncbi:hypothetical protein HPT27_14045 [Permianibacter sp. IMCC34836]|uniref:hypothetical protein n=1 Tax=Permianibacter fluminis TaxID=2738515 RepID=UPI001554192D|nr:hypothetical protein [Permianibacter fluminis]NQD38148.1 hypothetical protein [Permianibacter fluminis]